MIRLVGRSAPFFALEDQFGVRRAMDDYVGRPLIIVFFPSAFTPICSSELSELSEFVADSSRALCDSSTATDVASGAATGPQAVAVSVDSKYTLRALAENRALGDLTILSDFWPHGKVAARYGAFDSKAGRAGRGTVVDDCGIVTRAELSAPGRARDLSEWWRYAGEIAPQGA